jgi:heme A synthase
VTVEEDRASDKRIAIAFAVVLVVQVVLAIFADAGTYPLWVWLILAIGSVLLAGLVFALIQSRAEGTPLIGPRHHPPVD